MSNTLIDDLKRRRAPKTLQCVCVAVNGLHDDHCPLFDGRDCELAADAIVVFSAILKETNVPHAKILEALKWALEN